MFSVIVASDPRVLPYTYALRVYILSLVLGVVYSLLFVAYALNREMAVMVVMDAVPRVGFAVFVAPLALAAATALGTLALEWFGMPRPVPAAKSD